MEKKKIAILFGGCSTEYEVSLKSAHAVIQHFNNQLYEPILIGITRRGEWFLYRGAIEKIADDTWSTDEGCSHAIISPSRDVQGIIEYTELSIETMRIDAALPILHGKYGEDGTVQGLLELAGIPIIGCDTLCSSLCMDKELAHIVVKSIGVHVSTSLTIRSESDIERVIQQAKALSLPLFVKPARSGSSIGITKVHEWQDLTNAVLLALEYDSKIIIEEAVEGFEVGCAILGTGDELIIGEVDEIELANGFFDFTEKYALTNSKIHMPARIDQSTSERIKQKAVQIYKALGCRGFARVDLFLTPQGEIIFNEVNTIPGFTAHSRYPNMLRGIGITFEQLLEKLVEQVVTR